MIHYELTERGDFSEHDFNEKIRKALLAIADDLKPNEINSKEESRTEKMDYGKFKANSMLAERFFGTFIKIQISSKDNILGYLDCFMDLEKGFIELSSSKSK